jgi:hypothetical protein
VRYLVGEYVPTPRSKMCAAVLAEHNFVPLAAEHVAVRHLADFEATRDLKGVAYVIDLDNSDIPRHAAAPALAPAR